MPITPTFNQFHIVMILTLKFLLHFGTNTKSIGAKLCIT